MRYLHRRPGRAFLGSLVVVSLLFLVFPGFDLAASRWFFEGGGFPLTTDPALRLIRSFGRVLTVGAVVAALLGVLVPLCGGWRRFLLLPHQGLYVLTVYLLGPGLVVNGILKSVFGRARPREVLEFGGDALFTPVWVMSDACVGNCSFVSGEGAAAAALMSLVFAVPKDDRLIVGTGLAAVAAVLSANRIAFGGHFLSDVLIAWIIVLLIALILRPLFFGTRGERFDAAVYRAGDRCRRLGRAAAKPLGARLVALGERLQRLG